MGDFLSDTNLSELECGAPNATSTVLPESRSRSAIEEVSGLARTLFGESASEESLRLLKDSYFDASLLSPSFRQAERTGAGDMENRDCEGGRGAGSKYLRERFDVSEDDVSLLSPSFGQAECTGAGDMENRGCEGDRGAGSKYLRERFDVSEDDAQFQDSFDKEVFTDGAERIAQDEQQFEREQFLKIPQNASFSDNKFPDDSLGATDFGDLSRPSWWPEGSGDNKMSVSEYLRSRSAPMERVLERSPLFPDLAKDDSMTRPAPVTNTIQDLVNQELCLDMKSPCDELQTDELRESIVVHKPSVSEIDGALEDVSLNDSRKLIEKLISAARRRVKVPVKQQSSDSKTKKQEDDCFKRPLAVAPRTRASQQLTPTTSALRAHFRGKGPTSGSPSSSGSRIASSHTVPSPRKYKSHLPGRHKSSRVPDETASMKSAPERHQRSPASPRHWPPRAVHPHMERRQADSVEMRAGSSISKLSSLSSPDLRPSKRRSKDRQPVERLNLSRSDEGLATPERNAVAGREKSHGVFNGSSGSSASKFQTASSIGPSPTGHSANPEGYSGPAPLGLLMPARSVQPFLKNLGKVCAGVKQAVSIALVNPTQRTERYIVEQCSVHVDGQPPGQLGAVTVEFPCENIVCAGYESEIKSSAFVVLTLMGAGIVWVLKRPYSGSVLSTTEDGRLQAWSTADDESMPIMKTVREEKCKEEGSAMGFFVSTLPGAVEVVVGVAVKDKMGGITKTVHSLVLSAQVELPQLSLKPSRGLCFEGLCFDAEQGDCSRGCQELTMVNESSCPVRVTISLQGGNGVFSLRLKDSATGKLGQAGTVLCDELPSKQNRAETILLVECSTEKAECLAVEAKIQVEVDGCLLFRKVLATVGLSASIVAPSLSLEGISSDEVLTDECLVKHAGIALCAARERDRRQPIEVAGDKGQAAVKLLRNDGPCPLELELFAGSLFLVRPQKARIEARGSVELFVRAAEPGGSPTVPGNTTRTSVLEAVLVPQGFKMPLARLVGTSHANQDTTASSVTSSRSSSSRGSSDRSVRTLESNRRVLVWSGMQSPSESKCLTIRNPNPSPVSIELELEGQYGKLFRARVVGARDAKGASATAQLEAEGSMEVKVTHNSRASLSTRAALNFAHSKLIIKSQCGRVADTKSVALYAFSGKLQVDMLDTLPLSSHRHLVDLGNVLPEGSRAVKKISMFNGSDWDACVYFALPGSVFLANLPEPTKEVGGGELLVSPSCMVLRRKQTKVVTFTYQFGANSPQLLGEDEIKTVANVRILHSFEALRQAAKRSFAKAGAKRKPSKELQPFLQTFDDEGQTDAVPVPGNLVEEVFLKTVLQAAMGVIVSSGSTAMLLQASNSADSFAPLEDPTLLGRLSWLDVPQ